MKTIKIGLALVLLFSSWLYLQPQDSWSFLEQWTAFKKIVVARDESGPEPFEKRFNIGNFMGFIVGVFQMLAIENRIKIPKGFSGFQMYLVVGKYLEDHPELLHLPDLELTRRALTAAFPVDK